MVFCGIFILVLAAISLTWYENNKSPNTELVKKIQQTVNTGDQMKTLIFIAHSDLNKAVCWGNWEKLESKDSALRWYYVRVNELSDAVVKLRKARQIAINNRTKEDLDNALRLIDKGAKQCNVDLVLKAHRIIHDLDRFVFNPVEGKKYFGVTALIEK